MFSVTGIYVIFLFCFCMQNAMMVILEAIVLKSATAVTAILVPRRAVTVPHCVRLAGTAPTVRMVCSLPALFLFSHSEHVNDQFCIHRVMAEVIFGSVRLSTGLLKKVRINFWWYFVEGLGVDQGESDQILVVTRILLCIINHCTGFFTIRI